MTECCTYTYSITTIMFAFDATAIRYGSNTFGIQANEVDIARTKKRVARAIDCVGPVPFLF